MKLEVRKDYITDRRSVIAASRQFRPSDLHKSNPQPHSFDTSKCPFCPGNEHMTPPEIARYGGKKWKIRVFENKFPAFSPDARKVRTGKFLIKEPAFGEHDIIVDGPDHFTELEQYPARHVTLAFRAFFDRIRALSKDHVYVHWIKNRGKEGGASLSHSHSQVFAFDYVPQDISLEFGFAREYFEDTGKNIFDRIIEEERSSSRFIYENEGILVISPFAPRIKYEVMLISKKPKLPRPAYVADAFRTVVRAMDEVLGIFPYTSFIRMPPLGDELVDAYYRWNMRIMPRVQTWAGFELGTNDNIIPVAPEDWAKTLRDHI